MDINLKFNRNYKIIYCLSLAVGMGLSSLAHAATSSDYYKNILSDESSDWSVSTQIEETSVVPIGGTALTERYQTTRREQTVDLLQHGFTAYTLDQQPPVIMSELFHGTYCGEGYTISVEFLNAQKQVVETWSSEQEDSGFDTCHYGDNDASVVGEDYQMRNEFHHYGQNVRYIRWKDSYRSLADSQGQYRASLSQAYLGIAPPNLLQSPELLASWEIVKNGGDGFKVSQQANGDTYFETSSDWSVRAQTIDLLSQGYTPEQLDSGHYPIFFSGSYGAVSCPGDYYLKVTLLDQNKQALKTLDSQIKHHNFACDFNLNKAYRDVVRDYVTDYPTGVRYIRWEDGGKDRLHWSGHYGTQLFEPYIVLIDNSALSRHRVRRSFFSFLQNYWPTITTGILSYGSAGLACVGTLGVGCPEAIVAATAVTFGTGGLNKWSVTPVNDPATAAPSIPADCNDECVIDRITASLDQTAKGKIWSVDNNNEINILSTPSHNETALNQMGAAFKTEVQTAVGNGTTFIDITTLANIEDGEWVNTLATALSHVEANVRLINAGNRHNDTKAFVRIYLGMPGLLTGMPDYLRTVWSRRIQASGGQLGVAESQWDTHFEGLLSKLTAKLEGDTDLTVYVGGGRTTRDFNWNHSKIIAVDGRKAIVGGHNLWQEYFDSEPLFDTSVSISGDSAVAAHRYVDELWKDHATKFSAANNTHVVKWYKQHIEHQATNIAMSTDYVFPSADTNAAYRVIGIGQVGSRQYDNQIKIAILDLIKHAQHSVYLSQQSLVHPIISQSLIADAVDTDLLAEIALKAVQGREVKIILSNENAPHDTKSNASNREMLRAIWAAGVRKNTVANSTAGIELFCRHIKLGNLRIDGTQETYPGTTDSFANHSKTIMVDKQAFLIGSHNVYGQVPMALSEYVYVVVNSQLAEDYDAQYWQPLFEHSNRTFMAEQDCREAINPLKDEL
ncbi:phospholipase D-like domain-containing protein [Shewanella sp. YLB-07]|uniref:phospholipase D-like domain-containing protein n=1 Tax=Shewanella sp. YLB-07 TaxID=2601268 RepID=UPI0018844951|nr:phospholipase D-like domain-containing protein [Shewanella sp. YLB-07]